jgi:hypothetical protein
MDTYSSHKNPVDTPNTIFSSRMILPLCWAYTARNYNFHFHSAYDSFYAIETQPTYVSH